MKNTVFSSSIHELNADKLLILMTEECPFPACLRAIEEEVRFNMQRWKFTGQLKQSFCMTTNGRFPFAKIAFVGLGKRQDYDMPQWQEIGGWVAAGMLDETTAWDASNLTAEETCKLAFGMWLRRWSFQKYRKEEKPAQLLYLVAKPLTPLMDYYQALFTGIHTARELTAEPANVLYPETYAKQCLELQELGLKVACWDQEQLQELGANGILSVGAGSSRPPCMVVLHWNGAPQQAPIALVGKGVCYDSGGINIKNTHLEIMKWDKAAASSVVGALCTLARLKAPVNVVGVIGLAENMPDGNAMKPGDVIKMLSGTTVEVVDTDNEGRLILADCLYFAQEHFHPRILIDLGTLTLETMGALAGEYGGLFCQEQELSQQLLNAGQETGEKLWPLPMGPAFAKPIQSAIADIRNIGVLGFGESSSTAEFLKCFVKTEVQWAHLDIAGVAWSLEDLPLSAAGVTGWGVHLLTHFCLSRKMDSLDESLSKLMTATNMDSNGR